MGRWFLNHQILEFHRTFMEFRPKNCSPKKRINNTIKQIPWIDPLGVSWDFHGLESNSNHETTGTTQNLATKHRDLCCKFLHVWLNILSTKLSWSIWWTNKSWRISSNLKAPSLWLSMLGDSWPWYALIKNCGPYWQTFHPLRIDFPVTFHGRLEFLTFVVWQSLNGASLE